MSNVKNIVAWILSVGLAFVFIRSGIGKLNPSPDMIAFFESLGHTAGFMKIVGVAEIVGGALVLVPMLATWGAEILVVVMIGAVYSHLSTGVGSPAFAAAMLVAAAVLSWLRWPEVLRPGRK